MVTVMVGQTLRRVTQAVTQRPMLTNVVSGGVLGGVGDVLCQLKVEGAEELDCNRLFTMVVFGAAYNGGAITYIYSLYPRCLALLPRGFSSTASRAAVSKLLMDQVVHCPLIYTPVYYLATGVMQGLSVGEATTQLRDKYVETVVACAGFWTPFMFLNFRLLPVRFHVLTMQAGNLVWNIYLDFISHRSLEIKPS
jgi:protein Mpv17